MIYVVLILLAFALVVGAISNIFGVSEGIAILILFLIIAFVSLIVYLTKKIQNDAVKKDKKKLLRVLDWINTMGIKVGAILSIVGTSVLLFGFLFNLFSHSGEYEVCSYEKIDGSTHYYLAEVVEISYIWFGVFVLFLGIVLLSVALTLKRENKGSANKKSSLSSNMEKKDGLTTNKIMNLTSVSAGEFVVWYSRNSQADGYQIQYSDTSDFVSKMSVNATELKFVTTPELHTTVSGLTSGKKYYVRVRSYKRVNGGKSCSDWSPSKSIKVI